MGCLLSCVALKPRQCHAAAPLAAGRSKVFCLVLCVLMRQSALEGTAGHSAVPVAMLGAAAAADKAHRLALSMYQSMWCHSCPIASAGAWASPTAACDLPAFVVTIHTHAPAPHQSHRLRISSPLMLCLLTMTNGDQHEEDLSPRQPSLTAICSR